MLVESMVRVALVYVMPAALNVPIPFAYAVQDVPFPPALYVPWAHATHVSPERYVPAPHEMGQLVGGGESSKYGAGITLVIDPAYDIVAQGVQTLLELKVPEKHVTAQFAAVEPGPEYLPKAFRLVQREQEVAEPPALNIPAGQGAQAPLVMYVLGAHDTGQLVAVVPGPVYVP